MSEIVGKIIGSIRKKLEGKNDVAKRMILKQLLQLIDMRKRQDYMAMVAETFQLPHKIAKLNANEAEILKHEMFNVACVVFSDISDEDVESLKIALNDELFKCSPQGVDSLEALMRERLKDKLSDRTKGLLDGEP